MNNIFITGGTGFLGSSIIEEILNSSDDNIYALVRGKDQDAARERLRGILADLMDDTSGLEEKFRRVHVYRGDITEKNLGLDDDVVLDLSNRIDAIYCNAARTDINVKINEIRQVNVAGTKNVLDFGLLCKKGGRLKKINHISTAYVVGNRVCTFKESDLSVRQRFHNTYEKTKYEAEKLVHRYRRHGLDIDVFRPSIVLGRYSDGKTTNFKMFYQPLHFFSLELFDRIPASFDSRPNLINIDTVAKAIVAIAGPDKEESTTYHIASPESPDFKFVMNLASAYFGFKMPEFIPPADFDLRKEYSWMRRRLIAPYLPYFDYHTKFDITNTQKVLGETGFEFPKFDEENLIRLFEYCSRIGFIERKKTDAVVK